MTRVRAALTVARAMGAPGATQPRVAFRDLPVGGVDGRLWLPRRPGAPIVALPGVAPLGAADPRVVRACGALAASGHPVFVPDLAARHTRLDAADIGRIVDATLGVTAHRAATGPATLLGFSFGGAYALVAAADERLTGRLRLVACFGAYADLAGLLGAATTGATVVGGDALAWRDRPTAVAPLADRLIDALRAQPQAGLDDEQVALLHRAVAGEQVDADLGAAAAAIVALLRNRAPGRVSSLIALLPAPLRSLLDQLSPLHVADRVAPPVVLLHSTSDPAIPYAEALRLRAALPKVELITVSSFQHVDLRAAPSRLLAAGRDLSRVVRFAAAVLGEGVSAARPSGSPSR